MGCLAKTFYLLGKWTASRPLTNIFIGCIIIMIGTFGFINFQATVSKLLLLHKQQPCLHVKT